MGLFLQGGIGKGCGLWSAVAWVGLCCGGLASAQVEKAAVGWDAEVVARARFEAEPRRTHTREEYARVMNSFRAIYHADPDNAHAAEAVAEVAELLNEQGREFGDKKNVHDAAGQYEYLAKAYPADKLAPEALVKALGLLGAADAEEAQKVWAQLVQDYPREARAAGVVVDVVDTPTSQKRDVGHPKVATAADLGADQTLANVAPVVREDVTSGQMVTAGRQGGTSIGPLAVVTGIRHWSTASYTRVAIDLSVAPGEEIKYEAARVENPDRIFFDLGHARLTPELAGKSFNVTDDGFLTRVRAAQFSGEVTRVVLDVHHVTQYSAFLLPNPLRLIIDIHGKQGVESKEQGVETAGMGSGVREPTLGTGHPAAGNGAADFPVADAGGERAALPQLASRRGGPTEVSSLPPMPVTDGSASFGLPARGTDRVGEGKAVAPPRVVIASKSTPARPVPNTVVRNALDTSSEVAEVSKQPGMVEATHRPTSKPIAETSGESATDAHYVPRSRRKAADAGVSSVPTVKGEPTAAAPPTADGETSLMRALGLKIGRIVIDAGHGGHDSGTLGAGGIEEKDVVLDVALRLGKLLHDRLGAEVVYTRDDDTFVPLETRTAIANKAQADLFISVHANSSSDASVKGVEVYYLNFTSDPEAMKVAGRENAVSTESVHELSDLVKKIALKDKIDESKELAADVDASLYAGLRKGNPELRNRGVKKAPFVVLIGANMPSILAEISFVTNPDTAEKLETPEYREKVAESLYKGVAVYAQGINGAKPRVVEQAAR